MIVQPVVEPMDRLTALIVTLSCSLIVMNIKHHNINIGPVNQTMEPGEEEESVDSVSRCLLGCL